MLRFANSDDPHDSESKDCRHQDEAEGYCTQDLGQGDRVSLSLVRTLAIRINIHVCPGLMLDCSTGKSLGLMLQKRLDGSS